MLFWGGNRPSHHRSPTPPGCPSWFGPSLDHTASTFSSFKMSWGGFIHMSGLPFIPVSLSLPSHLSPSTTHRENIDGGVKVPNTLCLSVSRCNSKQNHSACGSSEGAVFKTLKAHPLSQTSRQNIPRIPSNASPHSPLRSSPQTMSYQHFL